MQAVPLVPDVFWVGVQDPDLRVFDIVMTTRYGTSYNAYLIKGGKKNVLIDTVKEPFFDEYINDLQKQIDIKDIDLLVVSHTEPDHAGSIAKLLDLNPDLRIIGSATALSFLEAITNKKFKSTPIKENLRLNLGNKTLRFIEAPFLHWPDSIYTYLEEDKLLFTCDSFGSHFSSEQIFNDLIDLDFMEDFKYYFDVIMGPFKPYVIDALNKIKDLPIDMICPGHGPVLRKDIAKYMELYREWATPPVKTDSDKPKIVMAYVSAYGYTAKIAAGLREGVETVGDFDFRQFDLEEATLEEVLAEIEDAAGLMIGSPTINGDTLPPVWKLLTHLSPIVHHGKVAMAFGAYGWSGEAVPNIEHRLNMLRMQVMPGLRINFNPSEIELEQAFTQGMEFGRQVLTAQQEESGIQWRCLVCGHIHVGENPPTVCPACGVSSENYVKVVLEGEISSNDSQMQYVLIGGGAAAVSAAQAIRQRDTTGKIVMLTEEAVVPYFRPTLTALLTEEIAEDNFYIMPVSWYENNNIDVRLSTTVTRVDKSKRQVITAAGEEITYDRLIIASGARNRDLDVRGLEKAGVYKLRSLKDAEIIKEALKGSKRAVVIGAGVLGLELAEVMSKAGIKVDLLEKEDRLMPKSLDTGSAEKLRILVEKHGIRCHLGCVGLEIVGDSKAEGVKMADGEILPADIVFVSGGIKPNIDFLKDSGIATDKGIIVDEAMRTDVSGIYAAGDVAQFDNKVIGHWSVALEMGKIAGAAAAGDWVEYKKPTVSTLLKAFGVQVFSLGETLKNPTTLRITEVNDPQNNFYRKSFVDDGVLIGEIIIAENINTGEAYSQLKRDSSGKQRANKWLCRVCGYVHEGPEPPDECPVCGAGPEMFEPIFD